ncbi:hypothetical protein PTSG_04278 [Salpingoeca rosetta]|uniref:Uncharacterized protein n=1 Tax=Salpingoeca rosetta (strain ATCC 50818 / BSB-021) TaxID=946362 RepID=F2U740_SALR5|nr:uncharacterized protein PTSG_04278 [Salpingoeca rosetta]EGD83672.1 hypothetical protein PTSG_04278 [Salpingoeca rosetta]|eukprot:XP_004995176.1 hypothetical protein PTSG_04278 [Salpingoeca rosetta]
MEDVSVVDVRFSSASSSSSTGSGSGKGSGREGKGGRKSARRGGSGRRTGPAELLQSLERDLQRLRMYNDIEDEDEDEDGDVAVIGNEVALDSDSPQKRLGDSQSARRALGSRAVRTRPTSTVMKGGASYDRTAAAPSRRRTAQHRTPLHSDSDSDNEGGDDQGQAQAESQRPWYRRHVARRLSEAPHQHPWYEAILSELSMDDTVSSSGRQSPGGTPLPDRDSLAYLYRNLYTDRLNYRNRKLSSLEPYHKRDAKKTSTSKAASASRTKGKSKPRSGKGQTRTRKRTTVDGSIVVEGETGTHTISAGKGAGGGGRAASSSAMTHAEWIKHKERQQKNEAAKQRKKEEEQLAKELEEKRRQQALRDRGHQEYERWLNRDKRARRARKRREAAKKKKEEQRRKARLEELMHETEENYKEWLYDYHLRRRKADAEEREKRRRQAELRREAKQRGQAAYDKWIREIELRPRALRFEQPVEWRGVLDDGDDRNRPDVFSYRTPEEATVGGCGPSPPLLFRDAQLAEMFAAKRR